MQTECGAPASLQDIIITAELAQRPAAHPNYLREKLAIQDLARQMSQHPREVIPRLVSLAKEGCEGIAAGVSLLDDEGKQFRWYNIDGTLSDRQGTTVPRDHSPGGICLDAGAPVLLKRPERYFEWMRKDNKPVPEVLLVPLGEFEEKPRGVLWVIAGKEGHFDAGHARVLTELAAFAVMALRMIEAEARLTVALGQQETLAFEMSHRVKNLFAVATGMVRLTLRGAATKEELAEKLTGRLQALSDANAIVRRRFDQIPWEHADFTEILTRILRPHDEGRSALNGPALLVGERATNDLALVFHELATNASKYGALSVHEGSVGIEWTLDNRDIKLLWREVGGPLTTPPLKEGYGSRLVVTTVQKFGGDIDFQWRPEGLAVQMRLPIASLDA